jgi:hypothetical protein
VFSQDDHPNLHFKAAVPLHWLAPNHALVEGNKRLAWTACQTFLAINAQWISALEDQRFDFVIGVATRCNDRSPRECGTTAQLEPGRAELLGEAQARAIITTWWHDFYNNRRPHSAAGLLPPIEYNKIAAIQPDAA